MPPIICAPARLSGVILVCSILSGSTLALLAQAKTVAKSHAETAIRSPETKTPKMEDIIKRVDPEYPYEDRRNYRQGKGLYRAFVDLKTGAVTKVTVIKSTGWPSLDAAVIRALRQWRLKPGKWKQFDLPMTYEMARSREEAMEKIRRLQAGDKH